MKCLRHIGWVWALALGWCSSLWAQQPKVLPEVTSTEGREFFVAWLPNGGSEASSTDLKLLLYANARHATNIIVEFANGATQTYPIVENSTHGASATIVIDPSSVYWNPSANEEEIPLDRGVRVYSENNEKFSLYSINQMGTLGTYSFDGAHILPVEALGTEYMVLTNDADAIATEFVIMTTKPGQTNVTMQLTTNSRRGNTRDLSVTLNGSKQIYIVRSKAPDPNDPMDQIDLSGSTICADQPIAVWSGNQYTLVPNQDGMSTDHAYDQILPVNKWGTEFIVPMTALKTQENKLRLVAFQANTQVSITRNGNSIYNGVLAAGESYSQSMMQLTDDPNPQQRSCYITASAPIHVSLFSSSAGANTWKDLDAGKTYTPSDPSMTLIPPLAYLTDTAVFHTYNGGDGTMQHQMNLWAPSTKTGSIHLDGTPITGWKTIPGTNYSQVTYDIEDSVHVITAPDKCFSGYAYGIANGQAYMYPIGYDFVPLKDSLFLKDIGDTYPVHTSDWQEHVISPTESGWWLSRELQDDGIYKVDTISVCDSTTLDFPIKTYTTWEKVRWELEGSIQGPLPVTPEEQESATVARPELVHQFTLLPIEQNNEPFEEFEVRGILYHKPLFCDIPEEKWEKDTFNTIVRVLRQYNDTVWKAICYGDTIQFFTDTIWNGSTYTLAKTVFNKDTHTPPEGIGMYQYQLGANTITRTYISSGGCDSLSTLKLFVCMGDSVHIDTVVCRDKARDLDFGEFFKQYKTSTWPQGENTLKDVLHATACMDDPDWQEWAPHCPNFKGCDSILELHLTVKEVVRNTTRENRCLSLGKVYDWYEKNSTPQRLIQSFNADDMEIGKEYTFRDTVKYVNCEGCPEGGCDSVRNVLYLTFVSDDGQQHTIHVCQNKTYTYTNMSDSYYFDARGKRCNTPYQDELTVHVWGVVEGVPTVLCEFKDKLTFIVDTVYRDQLKRDTICWDPEATDQVYTRWGSDHPKYAAIPVTGPGLFTYVDTLKTKGCKCDSICVLELRVGEPWEMPTVTSICDNDSVSWQDTIFYGAKFTGTIPAGKISKQVSGTTYLSRRDTVSQYGCDSILTFALTIHPTWLAEDKDTAICADEPYEFYGTIYNVPGAPEDWEPGNTYVLEYNDKTKFYQCDSLARHRVTVHPIYLNEREENDTVCQVLGLTPVYYEWEGADHAYWNTQQLQTLNTAGTFELVDYLETVHGCDSIIHRTLVIMPTYDLKFGHTMSSEETYLWENRIYAGMDAEVEPPLGLEIIRCTGITTVTDSLHTDSIGNHSCDSVRTLTLRIGQVFRDTMYDATCVNCGTYEWVITSPITGEDTTIYITDLPLAYDTLTYYDSLLTAMQFDSIYVLRLTAYPTYEYPDAGTVCQGEEFIWSGHPTVVIPTDTYGTIQIVDSLKTKETYTNPQTGEVKIMGCDSVWVLTLTIHPTYNSRYVELIDPETMSSNDTLSHFTQPHVLFVGYDFDYAAAGTSPAELEAQYDSVVYMYPTGDEVWLDSVKNKSVFGCDSVHYVRIAICQMKFTAFTDSIADNDSTWHFGGETAHRDHTLPLVTGEKFHYYDDGTPVDYTQAEGRTMREYFFIDTLRTENGCDSIVHQTLHVFPSYRFEFDTAICSNTRYDWRGYTYLNRGRTGYVYDSVNYQVGTHTFDSVYVLGLDVVPSGFWQYDTILCMNDTIYWHYQKIFYQPGGLQYIEAMYKDLNSMCGDIYRLNLTFMPYYSTALVEHDTICQLDDYHWFSPGESTEHTVALRDADGQPISKIPTDIAGDFVYYDSLHTASCGCDSTYTLLLHIKPSYHFYDTLFTLCSSDTLDWHGRQYYYQGQADIKDTVFDISTVHACDSNYYLGVHFDLSYDITDSLFLCSDIGHFTWEDIVFDDTLEASHYWDAPRDYYFTRSYQTTISHCDSIRHLKLRIAPSYDSIWTDTICRGETYVLFNQRLTQAGKYTDVQLNRFGCNTYYYLTLVEVPAPDFTLQIEPVCVDEQGLANNYVLHYSYTGPFAPISYSIRYGEEAKAIGFEDEADIPLAPGETTLYLPVPNFVSRDQYPRPNTYDAVIAFENGVCLSDSLMTYPFIMEMRYPSWITAQHWNDAIFIMDSTLNGGYSFASYQWYRNDTLLHGETKPYLYEPQYLHAGASYSVALTRVDDSVTVRTCPIIPNLTKVYSTSPEQTYISVVPTVVAKENPVVYILSPTPGSFKLMNPQGQLVQQGAYTPDEKNTYPVRLPQTSGVYVFHLVESTTAGSGNDLSRTVKVIVQ